jgi:hypothetical protein
MWNWFNCYLSGRHEFSMWCEPGTVFLRCMHCGRRSSGWAIDGRAAQAVTATASTKTPPLAGTGRVVPFTHTVAS